MRAACCRLRWKARQCLSAPRRAGSPGRTRLTSADHPHLWSRWRAAAGATRRTERASQSIWRAGSTIDVSGGGDLLAYEFVPGPGGSRDVLAANVRPNQFAIMPAANPAFAPYDPNESAGVNLQAGDTIWLGAGSGVPEGVYTLLPARYALLPGAYLVEAVSGYQDIMPGRVTQPSPAATSSRVGAGSPARACSTRERRASACGREAMRCRRPVTICRRPTTSLPRATADLAEHRACRAMPAP